MYTEEIKQGYNAIISDLNAPLKERRAAFLEDMVAYYSENPTDRRCVEYTPDDGTQCWYSPSTIGKEATSEGCAIGRKLSPEVATKIDSEGMMSASNISSDRLGILVGLGGEFLDACQSLHDGNLNWDNRGLSNYGLKKLEGIKNAYIDEL